MKNIGIDIDGVLSDGIDGTIRTLSSVYGIHGVKPSDIDTWDALTAKYGFTKEDEIGFYNSVEFFNNQSMIPLADVATKLIEKYYTIFLITSRMFTPIERYNATRDWLYANNITYHFLISNHNKKGASLEHGIKIFVEDYLKNALSLSEYCDRVYLFDKPYNQTKNGLPLNIIRVGGWEDVLRLESIK